MTDEELKRELGKLSEEDRELTEKLIKVAQVYSDTRKTFLPTPEEIQQRASEREEHFF